MRKDSLIPSLLGIPPIQISRELLSMNNTAATVGATPHANLRFAKKSASSRANSARRKLSRRYALATLSAAPLRLSGARRKAVRHAKDGFGFAGWWGVRGLRVRCRDAPCGTRVVSGCCHRRLDRSRYGCGGCRCARRRYLQKFKTLMGSNYSRSSPVLASRATNDFFHFWQSALLAHAVRRF